MSPSTQRTFRGTVAAVLLCGAAVPGHAGQDKYLLDYWETQVPNACTAEIPNNEGTFMRQYRETANQCPGLTVYHAVKGGRALSPWSTESFYLEGSYLKQMIELFINELNGNITDYRAFRDTATGAKGVIWSATVLPYPSWNRSWSMPPYVEEHWTDSTGKPVCYNTIHSRVDQGSISGGVVYWSGTYTQWLQDWRSTSLNPNTKHNIDTLTVEHTWGGRNLEIYTYGRWQNPKSGAWQGLGLIRWEWRDTITRLVLGKIENKFLVDCNAFVRCSTCPP